MKSQKQTQAEMYFDMIQSNYGLYRWEYDCFGTLLNSTCHWPELYEKFFVCTGCKNYMMNFTAKHQSPLILSTYLGMEWAAVRTEDDRIYVLGPAMQSDITDALIRQTLDAFSTVITAAFSRDFISLVHKLPVISLTSLQNLTLMMVYSLTGIQYRVSDIHYRNENSSNTGYHPDPDSSSQDLLDRDALNHILQTLGKGDLKTDVFIDRTFLDRVRNSLRLPDTLAGFQNTACFLGTLCAESAIRGGLLSETTYELLGLYMKNISSCRSIDETITVLQTLYTDFRNRTSKARTFPGISREIRNCCQYIQAHISEKLTVGQLAAQFGYTDYYFSRKFHAETGEHVLSYIRHAKIETAAFFLANTSMSIQEISDSLHFSNRNVFTNVFRQQMGCSPASYRKKHQP